jgi:hypothetical protein
MCFVSLLSNKPNVLKQIGVPENYQMMVPLIIGHSKAKQGKGKRKQPIIKCTTKALKILRLETAVSF